MRATAVPVLTAAHSAPNGQLIIAALVGIAVIVLLITWAKFHPFIALILGSAALAVVARYPADKTVTSFSNGVGSTVASVGVLIALGSMIGKLLSDSGGGETIVERITSRFRDRALPWAMALIAGIIGLPLFFEVGVVLLVPVVLLVAKRTGVNLMKIGIPALAGLSILHGFVPPHPGPLVAIATLNVDLGMTLLLGLVVAVPTLIICGPLLANFIARIVHAEPPVHLIPASAAAAGGARTPARHVTGIARGAGTTDLRRTPSGTMDDDTPARVGTAVQEEAGEPVVPAPPSEEPGPTRRPGFGASIIAVVLPVLLMLARAIGEITLDKGTTARTVLDLIGTPIVALLAGLLVAMVTIGVGSGMDRRKINDSVGAGLPPIAGIILIVAAGGGFKQMLVDTGVGDVVGAAAKNVNLSPLILGWLIAVGIRVATGSATVATITAAGIVAPLAGSLSNTQGALLALAIGAGSLFFSHVNDAGFWLVKEYFGMSVWETIKSWSLMETAISVVGLVVVLLLSLVL